jgi:hypothetical protein
MSSSYSTTIVSGYWNVKGKHSSKSFEEWFENTLSINCPYVFFGNQDSIDMVKKVRRDLPTEYYLLELEDFYTQKYRNLLAPHELHVPSPEVCMIWLEKVFLLKKAKDLNPFNSDFFLWVDAGICTYRYSPPRSVEFPCKNIMKQLPRDKFIFSSSEEPYLPNFVHENNYYHYISGTAFGCHKDFVETFVEEYTKALDKHIVYYNWVNTEQKILTHMYLEKPSLFFKLGEGYGSLVPLLFPPLLTSGCLVNPYNF